MKTIIVEIYYTNLYRHKYLVVINLMIIIYINNLKNVLNCIYIDTLIEQVIIFDNKKSKRTYKWSYFKNYLISFLDECYNKIINYTSDDLSMIFILDNIMNDEKFYFKTKNNQIILVNNDTVMAAELNIENLNELYKIARYIDDPMSIINITNFII